MKRTLLSTVLLAATAFSANANAFDLESADASLIVGYGSFHHTEWSRTHLNEVNPSIGVELYDISVVYVDKNSWNEKSFYVTWSPELYESKYLDVSAQVGFATGYKPSNTVTDADGTVWTIDMPMVNDTGIVPLVGVTAKLNLTDQFHIDTTVTPAVTMFSLGFDF